MIKLSFVILWLSVFLLPPVSAAEDNPRSSYNACSFELVCEKEQIAEDCSEYIEILGTKIKIGEDSACKSRVKVLEKQYEYEYQICLRDQEISLLKCSNLGNVWDNAVKQGKIRGEDEILRNGMECSINAQCKSGYCYPGPPDNKTHYCLARRFNCSFPNSEGVFYEETRMFEGKKYQCHNPKDGRSARWKEMR
ncbi:MAG: hypothetical protein NPIRA01_35980 [Nitrospirales bacterium]|nr:MAG: hypothetical protein NPIRA01_35980 [Nitrospirales bacterium]